MMTNLLAQGTITNLDPIGGAPNTGFGPWGDMFTDVNVGKAALAFTNTISRLIGILTIVAGIWFIFNFVAGAISFMTAGGSEDGVKKATAKITQSLIGLVVVVAAYAIISLLGALLGFEILNPQDIINKIGP